MAQIYWHTRCFPFQMGKGKLEFRVQQWESILHLDVLLTSQAAAVLVVIFSMRHSSSSWSLWLSPLLLVVSVTGQ